ncbi:MAG: RAD55 family ATPase [Candidatus Bathyarchaeia archaeon]
MKLVKTWVESLDEVLGGGLPDKSVVLMMGEPGSGHDILTQQILYQHALKEDKVAYFTTLKSPETLREDFETFGWDVSSLEKTNRWVFIDVHAPRALQILQKEIPLKVKEGRWTVVDSLSYILSTQKCNLVLKTVESLLENTQKHGGIHFLLLTQGMQNLQKEITIQHLVDGVIKFTAQEVAGGIDRRISVKKMRKTVYAPRLIPFNITEQGIVIETAIRIA